MASATFDQEARTARALREVATDYTFRQHDGSLIVEGPNGAYIVDTAAGTCSCNDWIYRASKCGGSCKHLIAARHLELEEGGPAEAPTFRVVGACRRTGKLRTVREGLSHADAEELRRKMSRDPLVSGFSVFVQNESEPLPW